MKYLSEIELEKILLIKDLSDKDNGVHAINLIVDSIKENLSKIGIPVNMISKSPITTPEYNYDKLYYPKADVTRNSVYTRWINENSLLRTHTTSMVAEELEKMCDVEDTIMMLHGLVYRRDVIDKTHVGEPHQLDVWRVSKNIKHNRESLLELVTVIINSILPNTEWRYNETNHYYTQNGIEVEVLINGQWMEILECGEILPKLLDDNGIDSKIYSGLALGVGLDRAVMIRKNIKDIRILRSENEKIKKQLTNLEPYKEVSKWVSKKRDLSVCVSENWNDEIIGDEIRKLNINIDNIEEIKIKNEWNYTELSDAIKEKLGIEMGYKNVLLSVTLSSVEKELSSVECNEIYNIIYSNLNKSKHIYMI